MRELEPDSHLDTTFTSMDESLTNGGCGDQPSSPAKTLFYLLDLASFFDLVQSRRWQAALDHMDQLGIFPINSQPGHIDSRIALFSRLSELIRRPLPQAVLAVMRCLVEKTGRHGAPFG